jgi:hypothetical protein
MYNLRKRPTYQELIYDLHHQEIIKYPKRSGINIINNMLIANLLFDDNFINDKLMEETKIFNKYTQTPYEKGTQTDILEKGTQKDFKPEHHDLYPHLYYKIDAFSKYMPNNKDLKNKNDASSKTVKTKDEKINDNISQTSKYIPGSLKKKSDNINQTVRYMLKKFESPIPTPIPTPILSPLPTPTPTEEELPQYYREPPGWLDWFFGSKESEPSRSKSSKPSVPSVGIRSPSESPPESEVSYIPPTPPSSPSLQAYVASEEEEVESQGRSIKSSKSNKSKK